MLFAVGDLVWIALIGCGQAVLIMIGSIVSVIVQKWEAKKVAKNVEEVKEKLEQTNIQAQKETNEVKSILEENNHLTKKDTHALKAIVTDTFHLVNSQMRAQLKLTADLSRWKADSTPDNLVHAEAARLAEQKLEEHDAQQQRIDAAK